MKCLILPWLALAVAKAEAQPVITNFSPNSGPLGTSVTIHGSGFNPSPGANVVTFGGINANVVSATTTALTVSVPGGTTYKPLTVETGGLTAVSTAAFDVTFPGGGSALLPSAFVSSGSGGVSGLASGLADFNGDGKMDMFSAQGFTQGLLISVNTTVNHTVSFASAIAYNTPAQTHNGAAAGDLDCDGKPDIIITNNYQTPSISVYRNTSSGSTVSFAANQDFAANNDPGEIAVGDIDGDGKPDLAIADLSGQVISFFRNTSTPGNISFAARVDLSPGSTPFSISIADIDGDGKPDLVLGTAAGLGAMRNLSSAGNFSFGPFVSCGTGNWLVSARAGDLNGDGKPDLVASDSRGSTIVVVQNNSTPGSFALGTAQTLNCSPNTNHVDIDDMDGDGKPDLVSSNYNYVNVSVWRNLSTAGSIAFDANVDYNVGNVSLATSAVADIDGNGRPDIIGNGLVYLNMIGAAPPTITSYSPIYGVTGTVVTILGTHFTTTDKVSFGGVPAQSYTINSDNQITAVVGGGATGNLVVDNADATVTALARFGFYPPIINSFTPAIGGSGTVVTIYGANFTNITDVKFGNVSATAFTVDSLGGITATVGAGQTGDITVISPNGMATISGFTYNPPVITGFAPAQGQVGTLVTITGTNFVADTSAVKVFFGAVKATLVSSSPTQITVKVPAGASYAPPSVTINTGRTAFATSPFLVTFPSDDPTITASAFHPAATLTTLQNPTDLTVTDFDGNGHPDMIVLDRQSDQFSIFLNHSSIGNFAFDPRIDINADDSPVHLLLQDMNGDGRPDVIVLNDAPIVGVGYFPSHVKVFPNISYPGYIGFTDQTTLSTPTGTRAICVADINGDALPDIIVGNADSGTITIYPNTTYFGGFDITFGQPITIPAIGRPDVLQAVDIDQDGRPDLVAADSAGNTLTVYQNTSTNGKFSLAAGVSQPSTDPIYITAGDLTGDNKPDLVSGQNATSAAISDLNGDGKPDIGFGRSGSTGAAGSISLWPNSYAAGPLSFAPTLNLTIGQGTTQYYSNDLDGDSKPDVLILNPGQNEISVLRNSIGDPVITGFSPDTAYKGTVVKLTGRNFAGGTNVGFGGVSADSIKDISATEIDATVGPGASGNVVLTTLFGIDSISGFVFIPQIFPEGDTVFCRGKYVMLRSTAVSNNQWFLDGIALGQDTVQRADSAGAYTVKTNSEGITTVSAAQNILLKTIPTPTIIDSAGFLVSSALTGNSWIYNGGFAWDTGRITRPVPVGTYDVTTTADGCTSDPSALYYWGGAQAIQLPDDQYIRYYPNPVTDYLYVAEHANGQPLLFDLSLMDPAGRTLLTVHQTTGGAVYVGSLPNGILLLHIHAEGTYKVDKTVEILKLR